MSSFLCAHCGAALAIPSGDALDAVCDFCANRTLLPARILALRAPRAVHHRAAPRNNGIVFVIVIVASLALLGLTLTIGLAVTGRHAEGARSSESTPAATIPPLPSPAPSPDVSFDPQASGAEQVSLIMKTLHARGCKDVLLAPTQTAGDQELETKFVVSGRCVAVIAVTGVSANTLTLTMKTPLGESIPAPPPSTRIELTVCPKMAGPHPMSIHPATAAPYTVAAIECPSRSKN